MNNPQESAPQASVSGFSTSDSSTLRLDDRGKLPWGAASLLLALALFFFLQIFPLLGATPDGAPRTNQNDFKHIYLGALLLSEGQSPYDRELLYMLATAEGATDARFISRNELGQPVPRVLPFVYLPFTGAVFIPVTILTFHQAAQFFVVLNGLLLVLGLGFLASAEGYKLSPKAVALCALPVLLNFTVFRNNTAGQLNAVLFFGACALYFQLSKKRTPWLSGLLAALLMLFKITPGIFLIWFLLTRRWAEAGWMLAIALVVTLITALIFGFDTHLQFLPLLADMGFGKSTWGDVGFTFWRDSYNQSLNSFFHHILVPGWGIQPWINSSATVANAATWGCALGILVCFAGSIWFRNQIVKEDKSIVSELNDFAPNDRLGFALAVLISLLAPSIMWDHYLIQALLPALVVWSLAGRLAGWRCTVVRGIVVLFWVVSSLGFDPGSGTIHSGVLGVAGLLHRHIVLPGAEGAAGLFWMSLKLWPTLVLFFTALLLHFTGALGKNNSVESFEGNKNSADAT